MSNTEKNKFLSESGLKKVWDATKDHVNARISNAINALDETVEASNDYLGLTIVQTDGKLTSATVSATELLNAVADKSAAITITKNESETITEISLTPATTNVKALSADSVTASGQIKGNTVLSANNNLDDVANRVGSIETLLQEDADGVINNVKNVIDYFKDVAETETGAALIQQVATNKADIADVKDNIVGKHSHTITPDGEVKLVGSVTDGVLTITATWHPVENQSTSEVGPQ